MSVDWVYHSGETCSRSSTRVYRSPDGSLGKVKRWRGSVLDSERYFVWSRPDKAAEYETEEAARCAMATGR